jgi:hypothetical protein
MDVSRGAEHSDPVHGCGVRKVTLPTFKVMAEIDKA